MKRKSLLFGASCVTGTLITYLLLLNQAPPADQPRHRLHESGWAERHLQLLNQPSCAILFLGDSITQFWESTGQDSWSRLADRNVGNFGVDNFGVSNFGVSGDQTAHLLWRISQGNELDHQNPKVVVLQIGTNNLAQRHTPRQVADGVAAILAALRQRHPETRILLLGILPRWDRRIGPNNQSIRDTNTLLATFADGKHVFFHDLTLHFLDGDGQPSCELLPDGLHPGASGYTVLADAVTAALQQLSIR